MCLLPFCNGHERKGEGLKLWCASGYVTQSPGCHNYYRNMYESSGVLSFLHLVCAVDLPGGSNNKCLQRLLGC